VTKRPERREQRAEGPQPAPGAAPRPASAARAPAGGALLDRKRAAIGQTLRLLPALASLIFLAPDDAAAAGPQPATSAPAAKGSAAERPSAAKPSAAANTIPPLTITQFRLASEVALVAAENGM